MKTLFILLSLCFSVSTFSQVVRQNDIIEVLKLSSRVSFEISDQINYMTLEEVREIKRLLRRIKRIARAEQVIAPQEFSFIEIYKAGINSMYGDQAKNMIADESIKTLNRKRYSDIFSTCKSMGSSFESRNRCLERSMANIDNHPYINFKKAVSIISNQCSNLHSFDMRNRCYQSSINAMNSNRLLKDTSLCKAFSSEREKHDCYNKLLKRIVSTN